MSSKYYVYVIELNKKVSNLKKFRSRNPLYLKGSGCVYIGQSIRTPCLRFERHKEGYKSNSYAREYGIKLLPELYDRYNPIPTRGCRIHRENVRRTTMFEGHRYVV